MSKKLYDLCVATRKFQENNVEKNHYANIGAMLQSDDDKNPFIMLKAHFNPAAIARKENSDSIFVSMFVPKDTQDSMPTQHSQTTKIFDLAVTTGQYTQNGQTKNRYENIGAVFENDKGKFMSLNAYFNPAGIVRKSGSESILVSCFTPKAKQDNGQSYEPQNDDEPQYEQGEPHDFNFDTAGTESEIPF